MKKVFKKKSIIEQPILIINRTGRGVNINEHKGYVSRVYNVLSSKGDGGWKINGAIIIDNEQTKYTFELVRIDVEGTVPEDITLSGVSKMFMITSDHKTNAQIWFVPEENVWKTDDLVRKSGISAYKYSDILNAICEMRYYVPEFNDLKEKGLIYEQ